MLTRGEAGLHSQLETAFFYAAVEQWDVLLLSEGVGLRKDCFDLSHVALLKAPVWEIKMRTKT